MKPSMPNCLPKNKLMSKTLDLAIDLLKRRSLTPEDAGCQEAMIARLEPLGFKIERMRFGQVDAAPQVR